MFYYGRHTREAGPAPGVGIGIGLGIGGIGGLGAGIGAGGAADIDARIKRASDAADEILKSRDTADADMVKAVLGQLNQLKTELLANVVYPAATDYRRLNNVKPLADRVDAIIAKVSAAIVQTTGAAARQMTALASDYVLEPMTAAGLTITRALPAADEILADVAEQNTLDLLSAPMSHFAAAIKVALRGIVSGVEDKSKAYERLQNLIHGAGFEDAAYRSERILRTEVGRTFTGATQARLQQVGKDLPFVRKSWRATLDDRTRLGHSEAADNYPPGQGIPINEPFVVNVYRETKKATTLLGSVEMMYPLDPNATPAGDLAAAATINCRCNQTLDFSPDDFRSFTRASVQMALGGPKGV